MDLRELLAKSERLPHRAHQWFGVEQLTADTDAHRGRVIPNVFALFDEVGAGKTKQIIDSAQVRYQRREIDTMLVLAPGFARSTWAEEDPALGEVAKHAWTYVPNVVHEFHGNYTDLDLSAAALHWIVTNYEFIRRDARRDELLRVLRGRRTWIVADESWFIKGNSDQTRAATMVRRKRATYATILNGTPLADGKPLDLYHQFAFLDPDIIGAKNKTHFRSKYCIMGGFAGRSIVDYKDLDNLNQRVAPYTLSRRTRDCFDLPPMLPPITVGVTLSDPLWKIYRQMRDDMVAFIGGQASVSKQAIVKILRLAQITSGYLGGIEDDGTETDPTAPVTNPYPNQPVPQWLRSMTGAPPDVHEDPTIHPQAPAPRIVTREVGREKLDGFLHWLDVMPVRPRNLICWCRFRPELERTTLALGQFYPTVLNLKGGQTPAERNAAKLLLAPGSTASGAVVGNQKAGGASLNFSAANVMVFLSNGLGLIERTQAIGRIERPGATQPMLIVDVVACGPKGQKTIDHHILASLRRKDDMAKWTVAQWRAILKDE